MFTFSTSELRKEVSFFIVERGGCHYNLRFSSVIGPKVWNNLGVMFDGLISKGNGSEVNSRVHQALALAALAHMCLFPCNIFIHIFACVIGFSKTNNINIMLIMLRM